MSAHEFLNFVPLVDGFTSYDWSDAPRQFRMVVDSNRLAKLVRNADTVRHYALGLDMDVTPMKTAFINDLKSSPHLADKQIAVTFNGLDLYIIGIVSDNGTERTEDWLAAFKA